MMKSILLFAFLVLLSCTNTKDEAALFQDAYSAVFESLLMPLEIKDPSVYRTLAVGLDEDVIRQELNKYYKKELDRFEFDIEKSISIWEKYKGNDLSVYVEEKHLHFLVPKESIIERGTSINFSAPVLNSDTSMFFLYMVFEADEQNNDTRSHHYVFYVKEKGSWNWMMATSNHPDN